MRMRGVRNRLAQGWRALRSASEPDERLIVEQWLSPAQRAAFAALPAHDRGHLIRVGRELVHQAPTNRELIVAGLLHDIGKQDGSRHVRLIDRTAKVLLARSSPRLLAWLARPNPSTLRSGIFLAVHHPELGAAKAASLGCTDRVVWLIKHHEDHQIDDPDLNRLIDVDRSTP